MDWITPPYYEFEPQQSDIVHATSSNGTHAITITVEAYLKAVLRGLMSNVGAFVNPDEWTGMQARSAQGIVDSFTMVATDRLSRYPTMRWDDNGNAIDPDALGKQYGELMVGLLQKIDSGQFNDPGQAKYSKAGVSVFDVWLSMTEAVK